MLHVRSQAELGNEKGDPHAKDVAPALAGLRGRRPGACPAVCRPGPARRRGRRRRRPPSARPSAAARQGRIKIDGVLDEVAWDKAQVLQDFAVFWQKRKARSATKARLLWDDEYLYFCAEMEDTDLYADVKEHNGMTLEQRRVRAVLQAATRTSSAYYEFQVNALNTQLEMFLPSRGAGGYQRFAPVAKLGMESAVKLRRHAQRLDRTRTRAGRSRGASRGRRSSRPAAGRSRATKWRFALCRYDYSVALRAAGAVLDGAADAAGLPPLRGLRQADVRGGRQVSVLCLAAGRRPARPCGPPAKRRRGLPCSTAATP